LTVPVVFGPEKEDVLKIAPKNSGLNKTYVFRELVDTWKIGG
jgi:hypothetical protein